MATVFDVARYVLNHGGKMTAMKLERIVYFCQCYSLGWDKLPLFEEDFIAQASGPICPELYETHKEYFELEPNFYDNRPEYDFDIAEIGTMDAVIDGCKDKEADWLALLARSQNPYTETRKGIAPGVECDRVISKDLMLVYFEGLISSL